MNQIRTFVGGLLLIAGIGFAGFGFFSDFISPIIPDQRARQLELLGSFFVALSGVVFLAQENLKLRRELQASKENNHKIVTGNA